MIGVFLKTELLGYLASSEKAKLPKSFSDLQNWMPIYDPVNLHSVGGAELNYFKNSSNANLHQLGKRINVLYNAKDIANYLEIGETSKNAACIGWLSAIDFLMSS